MAGYLPLSEASLYEMVPETHQPGAFPRSALLPNERVLFEYCPGFLRSHPIAVVWSLFWLVVLWAAGLFALGASQLLAYGVGAGVVWLLLSLPMFYGYYVWRDTGVALTDGRVVSRKGSSFESMYWSEVGSIHLVPHTSRIVFAPHPVPPGSSWGDRHARRQGELVWKRVAAAPAVLSLAQAAHVFYASQEHERMLRQQVVVQATLDRIRCDYCGYAMRIQELDPATPKCPRCSAPVGVAPARS